MADQWHVKWLEEGVDKWNVRRKKVKFTPDLSGQSFFDLLPPDYRDSPKTSRYFEGIDLSGADLEYSDLSGLNFSRANFSDANLSSADLSKSNFSRAKFTRANLAQANLFRSLFHSAVIDSANLAEVSFDGAELAGALIINEKLSENQVEEVKRQDVKIFPTRASYNQFKAASVDVIFRSDDRESAGDANAKSDKRTRKDKYDVFFGTNRCPVIERGALVGFDSKQDTNLSYGVCEVIVPEGRRIGTLGSPLWKRLFNRKDDRLKIESLISLNKELFWTLFSETSTRMAVKEKPTIFIHGYNNSFEDAVIRAAQIGYDLGLGQGIGLFSWPSRGATLKYNADEAAAEASKYLLADFIEQFVKGSAQQSANIIAHSMGCRAALGALEVLANGRKSVLKSISQVILAAADVDTAIMPRLAANAVTYCARTTSYASGQDKALKISGWLHDFPRVGISPPTFVLSGMDTILVNDLDLGDFSHGYVGSSRIVLNDIFHLLKTNTPPDQRHAIEAVAVNGEKYWRIRD